MPTALQFQRVIYPGFPRGGGFVGPLDAYTTGLLDAFDSEYRLLSSHLGGNFRVRESTGNTESVIGYTSAGIFDATAFNAHIGAGNGFGVRWINQTGATDCVQTSDNTKQGQILLNQIDGGAVLKMDGTNDGYAAFRNLSSRPWTIYLVEKGVAAGLYRTLQGISNNNIISTNRNVANNAYIGAGISNFSAGIAAPHVAVLTGDGSGTTFHVDGTDHTNVATNTTHWGQLCLGTPTGAGSAEAPNACVCTILVYNVAHDATTREAIRTILKTLRPSLP